MEQEYNYFLIDLPDMNGRYEVMAVPSKYLGSFYIQQNLNNLNALECGPEDAFKLLSERNGVGVGCYTLEGQEYASKGLLEALATQRTVAVIRELGVGMLFDPVELKAPARVLLKPSYVGSC
jgi:hypothetical protein